MIGHAKDENTSTAKAGLYDCVSDSLRIFWVSSIQVDWYRPLPSQIEFHDPESLIYELMLRAPGKPPQKKRLSESGQSIVENK